VKFNKFKRSRKNKHLINRLLDAFLFGFFLIMAIGACVYLYMNPIKSVFPVKHVLFIGNRHLSDDELKVLSGIKGYERMFLISNNEVIQRLLKSPWIRSVAVRKEFPGTMTMVIKESEPFALLDMHDHLFLIDENGKLLEEIKDDSIPFLPVITGDPYRDSKGFSEALKLAKMMTDKGISLETNYIEIILNKPHELSLTIDGTVVKIGSGMYEEKLEKLIELEEEIKNRGIRVDYIDLRFADKAIVKPVNSEVIH
jgi:cell division protein FtsQ